MRLSFVLTICLITSIQLTAQKTDPYHLSTGGFGSIIQQSKSTTVWWCEGAYKVMKDTRIPSKKSETVELWTARNEYEPVQLVINTTDTISGIHITANDLAGPYGSISSSNIEYRKVEYVKVNKPTDSYGYKGYWPDPLPLISSQALVEPGSNFTIWVNIFVPENAMPGVYTTDFEISSDNYSCTIPLTLNVWDFSLPDQSTMRSGFGLSVDKIADYHNITDKNDLKETFDLYMQSFRKYKISPYSFYYLHQIKKETSGFNWTGGYFDSGIKASGKYSLRVEDNSRTEDSFGTNLQAININPALTYLLKWKIKASQKNQEYTIMVEGYDSMNNLLVFENKAEAYKADTTWGSKRMMLTGFGDDVKMLKIYLFPTFRTASGENTGTVWFDDVNLYNPDDDISLLAQGDFEVKANNVKIDLDFTDFDWAAKRYLDEFGFNGFRLNLEGMGSGTYYSREEGVFEGFSQGTEEYKILMSQYLKQIQDHLEEKGWLGKEYIYWFDEPGKNDYPFVREGMELIKASAPKITTFLTENDPGPEIMDVTDVTCTIWHKINPKTAKAVRAGGQEYWSYLCTAPKAPWVSEFIDHDAINLRIWLWMSYSYQLNGILIWSSNYWTSRAASPTGYLQNPWEEPASFVQGYGWPLGKQTQWGNGDGRFWYPPNRDPNNDQSTYIEGPVPSIRLEFLRQGLEDYEYFILLEKLINENTDLKPNIRKRALKLLTIPETIFKDGKTYTKNPKDLLDYRKQLAKMILDINY